MHGRLLVLVWLLGLILFGGSVAYAFALNGERISVLCHVLRPDVERRLHTSENYLRENPNGTPGIPVRLIRESIRDQQQTLRDLDGVGCHSTTGANP